MDYRVFRADRRFVVTVVMISAGLSVAVSLLFYDTWWGMLSALVFFPVVWKEMKVKYLHKRRKEMKMEFRETIILLSGNLEAGYSLENAMTETYRMLSNGKLSYPIMLRELYRIVNGIACGQSVDELFLEFGERSGVQEILDFAGLLQSAKHFGGNISRLIRQTATNFTDAAMIETEIDTLVSAKRLEGRIMLAVPFLIIVYLRLLNPEYVQALYVAGGNIIMTICLIVIGVVAVWIEKIVRIEV